MPFGKLLDEEGALREVRDLEEVVTVGDVVSLRMLENGVHPRIMIFDLVTERQRMDALSVSLAQVEGEEIVVKNPAGCITPDLVRQIRRAMRSERRTKMQVLGEEDLAALVCAFYAPDGTRLLYGLPKKGIVLVEVDQKVRDRARDLIESMEECN
jgi:uncharacterized protein (UPF0218 family)